MPIIRDKVFFTYELVIMYTIAIVYILLFIMFMKMVPSKIEKRTLNIVLMSQHEFSSTDSVLEKLV